MESDSKSEIVKGNNLLAGGGLSLALILQRQEKEGLNELPSSKPKKIYSFFFEVLKEPMVYLLLGCGIVYFFLGDHQEAIMLLAFLFLIIGITIIQETKAGRALEALRELSSPRALVLRNGKKIRIAGREVVREEIIFLSEGDRVPADSTLISGTNIAIDESLLTGESVPVAKKIEEKIFASTTVIRGQGIAVVDDIGSNTQIGKIGSSIQQIEIISTRLEQQTNKLVKRLAWLAFFLCALVVIVYSVTHHNWIEGSLIGLSLGMAILPNELPAVLTIFFAMGAWRLSKRSVLTRKISAVENLGSITVLCVDKTGTLTLNQMAIQKIYSQKKLIDLSDSNVLSLPEEFHETLEFGILASRKDPFDPMELAFTSAGLKFLKGSEHLHHDWNLEKEYPLSPELLSITHAWKPNSGGGFVIGAKGAPEAIIDLCHMNEIQTNITKQKAEEMASLGLRVLGVAKSRIETSQLPSKQHDFEFSFLGLIGITDPIRAGIQESISECHSAGIRVIMLTGDHPLTASSIAKKIGLQNPTQVITGTQMESLSDVELVELTKNMSVFSRVMPSQKLRLVDSLKKAGEIVAMTGDGVNDAPALKSAHIGIAMGGRGTDVARESSAIVLLDDDFSSIVEAIRTGRRVYTNIKNALIYLFAIHIPIAGMSVLPVLLGLPLVLLPAHIALLHLIIEPASSIAFEVEPASSDSMTKKPRSPSEPLFNNEIWHSSLLRGTTLFAALASVYFIALGRNHGEEDARTLVFSTLILSNTFLIFLSRGSNISLKSKFKNKPNNVVMWLTVASIVMLGFALYLPALRAVLRFSFLHPIDVLICTLVSIASTFFSELLLVGLKKMQPAL
ncbi:MAG: cation-translocating P-type ATPase [Bacteriovorax sp.]|nr:cation-translocating P-type ATPase [Bacteriovorax sp.]